MNTSKLSRRRLLGGLLATLTAWLCPRPPHAAASRRSHPLALPPQSRYGYTCTCTYDGRGRLAALTEDPLPCLHGTSEPESTFLYYG